MVNDDSNNNYIHANKQIEANTNFLCGNVRQSASKHVKAYIQNLKERERAREK